MHPLLPLLPISVGLLLGWLLLARSRHLDAKGYVFRRAPALPIRALSAHDDAWLRGQVRPADDGLLTMPRFGHSCAYYTYEVEEKRTRTVRDSKGRTRTETYWATVHSEADAVDFMLEDDTGSLLVPTALAESIEAIPSDREGGLSRRYSGSYLPSGHTISVLGVRDDEPMFSPRGEVPLLITGRSREEKVRSTDRSETFQRRFAWFLMFLGAAWSWGMHLHPFPAGPLPWVQMVLVGLGALVPVYCLTTYNRFIRLRQQRRASWRQIDVDLATRSALVPNLVDVVKTYSDHEGDLLQGLAALRNPTGESAAIAGEQQAHNAAMGFLALGEAYPELQANPLFLDLHERLWAIEEKLAASRDLHNRILTEWNDLVQSFPAVLLAKLLGHSSQERFSVDRSRDPAILRAPGTSASPADRHPGD